MLVHQPLLGDPRPFASLLDDFRRVHPEVPVVTRVVPSSSDVLHQYLLTTLEGRGDVDVFVADVIWVSELARAGWIRELDDAFPAELVAREFLPGAARAVTIDGRVFAVPFWIDVGVLYTRTDRAAPPTNFAELRAAASRAGGYLFQGRQYEGLVCNAYEAIWAFGGATMEGERIVIDTPEAREALDALAAMVRDGLAPRVVISAAEEECRRAFEAERGGLLRSWPYVLRELQRSPLRERVAMTAVPGGHGCLGGWNLAIAAHVPEWKRAHAVELVRHLTSEPAQRTLALAYGRPPSRRALYRDASLPTMTALAPIVEDARPRPVSPWYPRVSDVLQGELSAIVCGLRSSRNALARARAQIDRVMTT